MRSLPAAAGRKLARVRDSLSAEQRWTAGLALLLAVSVLLFGHPRLPAVLRPGAPPLVAAAGPSTSPGAGAATESPPALAFFAPVQTPANRPAREPSAEPEPSTRPATPLRVTALVVPGGPPGRDDGAAARAFLGPSSVEADVVVVDPADTGLCERVAASADVAVAGLGLDDALRRCLSGAGVVVLAFDGRGPLAAPAAGAVVSTRRGVIDSLSDAVGWGMASGALRGRVGLVASTSIRREVEEAAPAWRATGLDLAATAFVPDAGPAPPTDEVRRLAAAGVEVVFFALPAASTGRWALQHSLLDRSVRYVIGDAFDALWDETYPPVLDGALAHTSLRVPWFAREHGETTVQAACRQRWEGQVAAPTLLPGAETVTVYAWCQHVALLETLRADAGPAAALRTLMGPSPLTSDLGPLPGAGWGPTQDAVVSWRAACTCWRSVRAFADRGR